MLLNVSDFILGLLLIYVISLFARVLVACTDGQPTELTPISTVKDAHNSCGSIIEEVREYNVQSHLFRRRGIVTMKLDRSRSPKLA